uniref:thioester reductase domain-containing protein n=1 Tax=Actinokineospora pegani TaxID=2654637 RepID=UPI0038B3AB00
MVAATVPDVAAVAVQRATEPEVDSLVRGLGEAHVRGVVLDWKAFFGRAGRPAAVPTYPFQRQRFWVEDTGEGATAQDLGVGVPGHPLLDAVVGVAGRDEAVLTGRVTRARMPWAVDGEVSESTLVTLAARAGDEVGAPRVTRLSVATPLVLPARGGLHLQVRVGPEVAGGREVTVHSRPDDGDHAWAAHATGRVTAAGPRRAVDTAPWPGAATPVGDRPAVAGVEVRGLWRDGEHTLAELALTGSAAGHAVHPALFDAALLAALGPDVAAVEWTGFEPQADGATTVRARVAHAPDGTASIRLTDTAGGAVAEVERVRLAPRDAAARDRARLRPYDGLMRTHWSPVPPPVATPLRWGALGQGPAGALPLTGLPTPGQVDAVVAVFPTGDAGVLDGLHRRAADVLALIQRWSADEALADVPLVVRTHGVVDVLGEGVADVAGSALWGLLRSAQSENACRVVLLDADSDVDTSVLDAVVATGEPQVAARGGELLAARLRRVVADNAAPPSGRWDPSGTVLVTGGTGTLGALVARHLVTAHGVRDLVLTSRSGAAAPGAAGLVDELTGLGARVEVIACDAADRDSLRAALAAAASPVTGVVHTAGVTDDGLIGALTPERLDKVLGPKADAAWHLHELTREHPVTAFVVFSSLAAAIGGAGQGNYAAANAFLDGLAAHRGALGLPATSVAWGLWSPTSGVTAHMDDADRKRVERAGYRTVEPAAGLAMLDAALRAGPSALVAAPVDQVALRARPEQVPPVLRAVAGLPSRPRAGEAVAGGPGLSELLAGLAPAERLAEISAAVTATVADVLGAGPADVRGGQVFPDMGFDSLLSVELRNRLATLTERRLPATLVFDHPTPDAVAAYLDGVLGDGATAARTVDFAADVRLDDAIQVEGEVVDCATDPRRVLLTGATGFLGAFLLRELLRATDAVVHCLVRAADAAQARARLVDNLRWYRLDAEVDLDRVVAVPGDLASPRLGLTEDQHDELAREMDAVYHAGAGVNWLLPYPDLRAVNVVGTEEVLRLAARHRTVPVHHVSTTGVFAGPATPGVPLAVTDVAGPPEALPSGYVQSKWVAEQMIDLARLRGLPVSVYRVDLISGDRTTGACQTRDYVWLAVKGLVQAGARPEGLRGDLHMVPVDFAASALVQLSRQPAQSARTFHIDNRDHLSFATLADHLADFGYPLQELPVGQWRSRITADRDNPLITLLDAFDMMLAEPEGFYPAIDTSETEAALAASGITCPGLTPDLVRTYLGFFVESGYLPAPTALVAAP